MKKKLSNNTNNSAINSDAAVDWTNEEKVREYTEKVFLNKFQINVTLPNDRLCPPLPNRLNYITWLNHLIQLLPSNSPNLALNMNMFNPILPEIRVLDIGTGVSCVYPILGTKLHGWKFLASDIDPYAIQHVNHTLSKNSTLQSFILPVLVPSCERIQQLISERYLPLLLLPPILDSNSTSQTNMDGCEYSSVSLRSLIQEASQSADPDAMRGPIRAALSQSPWASIVLESEQVFLTNSSSSIVSTDRSWSEPVMHACMCNPPFFDLDEEITPNDKTACTGNAVEMRTCGGEVAFVSAMIADSLVLRHSVTWYTSMLGKKSSLKTLLRVLASEGVTNVRSTRFTQGRTMRWGIAWSHTDVAENTITDTDKVFAWNRLRRKYRQRQQTDMGMDEGTDGKPVINLDRRRLDSFQLRELDSELVAVTRVFTLTGAEIPITCTKEERAVYEHRLSRRRSQQQLTHGQSVTTWDYLDCLNVLEERLCAAVSAFSSTEQCTTFFLKAFQSELLERENSGSEESDDDDDDDEEGEEGDDDDNDESTKALISDKTAIGMDVNEVNVKDAYSAYNGHRTDNGSNMMVESPRSTVLSKTLTSIDSTARTVTSDAESVHIPAEPVRPILIAVRRASGYATQIVPVSEQLPTQVDPHMQTQIQTQTQSSVRMRFQVQLQCRQCPDNTYVYFINLRLDNQHLATSVNRGAVVKEFRIFAEKFELDVKRNNRRWRRQFMKEGSMCDPVGNTAEN